MINGDEIKRTITKNIVKYREKAGISQKELAKRLNVLPSRISNWEQGSNCPTTEILFELCKILGITINDIYGIYPDSEMILSYDEQEYIKKYRFISEYSLEGAQAVDAVLDKEYSIANTLKEQQEYIVELQNLAQEDHQRNTQTRLINYYYRLASAGTGQIIFDTPPTKRIEIPDIPKYKHVDYAIGVNGVSMEPTYKDNDTLLVEMTDEVDKGEIGIFSVDNNCYVKKRGDKELISLNPNSPNVPMNESARCMGKVIDKLNKEE